jgi:hypothetical protein
MESVVLMCMKLQGFQRVVEAGGKIGIFFEGYFRGAFDGVPPFIVHRSSYQPDVAGMM